MRWSILIGAAALLGGAAVAQAQTARPANNAAPSVTGYVISEGVIGPALLVPNNAMPAGPAPAPLNVLAPAPQPSAPAAVPVAAVAPGVCPAPNMLGGDLLGAAAFVQGADFGERVPLFTRGAIKISENESPRPQDRVFVTYNYFNNVHVLGGGDRHFDLHRETFGFEKTFLDGDASVGLRVPVVQKDGLGGVDADGFGDLTVVTKFALLNDRETGDVLSGGLVVTVPTGRQVILADGDRLDAVLLQPWLGFVVNSDRLYVQGFTAVITSTDRRDVTFLTGDLGVGYKLYVANDGGIVTQLIPTVEFHANVPLNHNGVDSGGLIVFPYQFVVTGGVHVGLGSCATLSVGAAVPVSGPKPYDFGLLCQLNVRF